VSNFLFLQLWGCMNGK